MQQSSEVIFHYCDLESGKDLSGSIQKAFGPNGQGILFVQGVPQFEQLRKTVLPLIHRLASLPKKTLQKYERPELFHSLGWSHGVEKFHGRYDLSKGSFYINCCTDNPPVITQEDRQHYTEDELQLFANARNKWVEEIPELEKNVKQLSGLMRKVGGFVAHQIDNYCLKKIPNYQPKKLQTIIHQGRGHIGRLLHYFPFKQRGETQDDWCGWHNDFGSLTALCPAMYTDEQGNQLNLKTESGGLHAMDRTKKTKKIPLRTNMLAFQLGESAEIHTGGFLEATPHCVVRSDEIAGKKISRNTFALFMQPNHLEPMTIPEGVSEGMITQKEEHEKVTAISKRWENGITFKEFTKRTLESNT